MKKFFLCLSLLSFNSCQIFDINNNGITEINYKFLKGKNKVSTSTNIFDKNYSKVPYDKENFKNKILSKFKRKSPLLSKNKNVNRLKFEFKSYLNYKKKENFKKNVLKKKKSKR